MSNLGHQRYRIGAVPHPRGSARPPRRLRPTSRIIGVVCWIYAVAIVAAWAVARWAPPESWPIHLLLYGPRWFAALPLLPLIPLAVWRRSRWSIPALGIALAASMALWGPVLPRWWPSAGEGADRPTLRLLTCNVQYSDLKVDALADLIREARPTLVLLQECRLADPKAALGLEGWDVRTEAEFCLASRLPIVEFAVLRRPDKAYRAFAVGAEVSWMGRSIPIVSAHLMTPRKGLEAIIRSPVGGIEAFRKVAAVQRYESELLRRWVANAPDSILLAGDFNLTVEHPLYRRDWSGYSNAFSEAGLGLGQTMFTRKIGLRIDHVLGGPGWKPERSWVGPDVGSAHRPLLVDLAWLGPFADRTEP